MVTVKFATGLGKSLQEYVLPDNATAQDLLNTAGYVLQQNEKLVKKGGGNVDPSAKLSDGDVIVVSMEVKGA